MALRCGTRQPATAAISLRKIRDSEFRRQKLAALRAAAYNLHVAMRAALGASAPTARTPHFNENALSAGGFRALFAHFTFHGANALIDAIDRYAANSADGRDFGQAAFEGAITPPIRPPAAGETRLMRSARRTRTLVHFFATARRRARAAREERRALRRPMAEALALARVAMNAAPLDDCQARFFDVTTILLRADLEKSTSRDVLFTSTTDVRDMPRAG